MKGKCKVAFATYDKGEEPTAAAVALAARVLDPHADLVLKLTEALWRDMKGRREYDSGMWWHGDLDQVIAGLEKLPAPDGPDGLLPLLRPIEIAVKERIERYPKPVAEINFWAAFEEEHGVGVLTDGRVVLGTGYSTDAEPFKKARKA
jgi:hypothetical protein